MSIVRDCVTGSGYRSQALPWPLYQSALLTDRGAARATRPAIRVGLQEKWDEFQPGTFPLKVQASTLARLEPKEPLLDALSDVPQCAGATHVVVAISMGHVTTDGSAPNETSCADSNCDVISVELSSIESLHESRDYHRLGVRCPAGFVRNDAACVAAQSVKNYTCNGADLDECAEQCDAGNDSSCVKLASLYLNGGAQDKAGALTRRLCEHRNVDGCAMLGYLNALDPAKRDTGTEQLQSACEKHSTHACAAIGALTLVLAVDHSKTIEDLSKGCDGGVAQACRNLGVAYRDGTGATRDPELAKSYFERACAQNDPGACTNLSLLIPRGNERDDRQIRRLLEQACPRNEYSERAYGGACLNLADIYASSSVSSESELGMVYYAQAYQLSKAECGHQHNEDSCYFAGYLALRGLGTPKNPEKAAEFFDKSCDEISSRGCVALGRLLESGLGVAQDFRRAEKLYRTACRAKNGEACASLVRILANNGEQLATLTSLASDACDADDAVGCEELGELRERSGERSDVGAAMAAHRRGCDLGDGRACMRLAGLVGADQGSAKAQEESARLADRACLLRVADGCIASAATVPAEAPPQRKNALLGKACELGAAGACAELIQRGVTDAVAPKVLKAQCDGGKPEACDVLGYFLVNGGPGIAKDLLAGASAIVAGCDGQSANSCRNLGVLLSGGQGLERDAAKAYGYFRTSCKLGDLQACTMAGRIGLQDRSAAIAPEEPMSMLFLACTHDVADACVLFGDAQETGQTPSGIALQHYSKACSLNSAEGCLKAGKETLKGRKENRRTALLSFEAGCKLGDPECCYEAGRASQEHDKQELYRKLACEKKFVKACSTTFSGKEKLTENTRPQMRAER
jgi:TPR repeat protein